MITACSATEFNSTTEEASSDSSSNSSAAPSAATVDQAKETCDTLRGTVGLFVPSLAVDASVNGLLGSGIFSADRVLAVRGVTGSLVLFGQNADSAIESVNDLEGSLIVCDMDVKSVNLITGSVIVVNGQVGDVSNVSGSVLVVHGSINGSILNSTGSVLAVQ